MLLQGDTAQAVWNGIPEEGARDCPSIQTSLTINFQIKQHYETSVSKQLQAK